jgi:hypothetical protein
MEFPCFLQRGHLDWIRELGPVGPVGDSELWRTDRELVQSSRAIVRSKIERGLFALICWEIPGYFHSSDLISRCRCTGTDEYIVPGDRARLTLPMVLYTSDFRLTRSL